MKTKFWLESMDRPAIQISAVGGTEPVRGHSHFNKSAKLVRSSGRCVEQRKNHAWVNGYCFWCGQPRTGK